MMIREMKTEESSKEDSSKCLRPKLGIISTFYSLVEIALQKPNFCLQKENDAIVENGLYCIRHEEPL